MNKKQDTSIAQGEKSKVEAQGPLLSDLEIGSEFVGFYLARNVRLGDYKDASRGQYACLQLRDYSATIPARIWENGKQAAEQIKSGAVIKVDGIVSSYNDIPQVQIRCFRLAREGEFDPARLMAYTHRDMERMWSEIAAAIDSIQDPHLAALLAHFFQDQEFVDRFKEAPAAKVVHHAYFAGLMEHCYELLRLGAELLELYPEINRDLLIAGILLHDLGKLEEYECEYDVEITDAGRLLGHVVLSARMASAAIARIEGFPQQKALEVLHMIVSHHGRYEWGAPRRPKSLEAMALHLLDNLDAQVNRYKQLIGPLRENGKTWTQYDRMLGRMLYAGEAMGLSVEENGMVE